MIKGQPCPCCRKIAHDKNGHVSQCAVLFQILFYDLAHGLKRTNKHRLDAHFKALPRTETPALRRPPSFDSPADPPASPGGPDGEPPRLPRPFLNPSNYCYGNALLSALTAAPAAALHRELLSTGQMMPHNAVASSPPDGAMTASNRTPPNSCWPSSAAVLTPRSQDPGLNVTL